MTDAELEQRDEQVAEALEAGRSLRTIRREFALSQSDLDTVLERLWPIDQQARLRLIKRDLGKLDRLLDVFYAKGLQGDTNSAGVAVKIFERLHTLVGLDAVQRIDLQIVRPPEAPTQHERVRAAIMRMVEEAPPAQRALRKRLEQLSPEKALEMLGPLELNGGDGAVDEPSLPDDTEPSN